MRALSKTLLQALLIAIFAAGVGLAYNAWSSNGIPLRTPEATSRTETMDWELHQRGLRASLGETRAAFEKGGVVIVDARSPGAYARGHIPGAINLPTSDFARRHQEALAGTTKDTPIIVYCAGGT